MRVARTTEAFALPPSGASSASELPSEGAAAIEIAGARGPGSPQTGGTLAPPFVELLRGLGHELDCGENITEKAIRGGQSHASPERLIALQAGIYRYSEAVDLVTKLVDKGTQAVRTTLQNQ